VVVVFVVVVVVVVVVLLLLLLLLLLFSYFFRYVTQSWQDPKRTTRNSKKDVCCDGGFGFSGKNHANICW